MNNEEFLKIVKDAFEKYLETGSRSNYELHSLGYKDEKEVVVSGRYMNKKVDIGIEKDNEIIAAIALKFIMRNYSQNSNNYFENMLGETANIRAAGKPYFQILIIPSKVPYFKNNGDLDHIEIITKNNLEKYIKLSHDDINNSIHTPTKTLIYIIDIPDAEFSKIKNNEDYVTFYKNNRDYLISENNELHEFGESFVYNNYNEFIDKVIEYITTN